MASTPFFFLSILFLAWFTTDALSVKVIEVLKGSSIVLSPGEAETSIISITWKHGDDLAADWFGGDTTFYRIYKDRCSLNTKTGELTINNVRPEHGGEYTPDINGKTRSTVKLRVFSPVPNITIECNLEQTNCTLTCSFDIIDDLGDVEVFWILDDRREKGTELQITKETKEETFMCSLKNPVSSQNSIKLQNPLLPRETCVPVWIPVVVTAVTLVAVSCCCCCWMICRNYPETNREAEDQNTDPPEEANHQTDSGSAENDLPEAERPEASSGSPDGTVSTSELS
uniref:Ig-like domain-containing protein n=1 Tax=Oryzias latipes TaxID=8090 RepID=A0A3B3IB05_ORYLA